MYIVYQYSDMTSNADPDVFVVISSRVFSQMHFFAISKLTQTNTQSLKHTIDCRRTFMNSLIISSLEYDSQKFDLDFIQTSSSVFVHKLSAIDNINY